MVTASANAGPDIYFCNTFQATDQSITMQANGTTGFWQYTGANTPPSIGSPTSPTTKIFQPACSAYEYSWTISSQSLHIINGDTHSVTCEDTDTMTVFTKDEISSGSITGIMDNTGVITPSIYKASEIDRAPYEINITGCPPYQFSFLGTVDSATNHTTWSVYMSESLFAGSGIQSGPVATYPNKANDGVMGKFSGNNPGFGFMIGGTIINSESNSDNIGRTVAQQTHPPGFPHPGLVSRLFNFSSSFTASYGVNHFMSLTAGDTNCGCDSGSGKSTYGTMVFRPSIVSFDIVVPEFYPGYPRKQHLTADESTFDELSDFTCVDPVLGIPVPKYDRVIIMSMHSGSNNLNPTTASSVCSKGDNNQPMSPYLTMSFCSSIDWPIHPITKMGPSGSSLTSIPIRSAISTPHKEAPYWPGPGGIPGRSFGNNLKDGLTSASIEPLRFEWRTREIAVYRNNGSQLTSPGVITGSFTDTMTSVSYEEAPNFFPALRNSGNTVQGLPNDAVGAAIHTGYNQLGGSYAAVASQSLEFQCTMSRLSLIDNSVISQHYASKSVMFTLNSSCLLYTSPSPRDRTRSRMPSSA